MYLANHKTQLVYERNKRKSLHTQLPQLPKSIVKQIGLKKKVAPIRHAINPRNILYRGK